MKSLSHEKLVAFVNGRASREEAEELFLQLSEDEQLQRRVRAIQSIQRDFDTAWEAFQNVVASAADHLALDPQKLTVLGSIRALVDGAEGFATAAGARMRELVSGALSPIEASFEPVVAAGSPQAGLAMEHARRASELVAEGSDRDARSELSLAATHNRGVAERAVLVLRQGGAVVGEAHIDAADRSITITLEVAALGNVTSPVALLEVDADGATRRAQRFERAGERWITTFDDVDDGVVLLQLAAA